MVCKKTCGFCDDGSAGEVQRGTPPPKKECIGDSFTFDSGFGNCKSYGRNETNFNYCRDDFDLANSANFAVDVCPQCGVCIKAPLVQMQRRTRRARNTSSDPNAVTECADEVDEVQ